MMSFYDLIRKRRSTRKFTEKPVDAEVKKLLQQGVLMSPASKRSNPWKFVFVEDKTMITTLSECKEFGSKFMAGASLAIVVCADPAKSDVWIEDTSIASIYLQLLAEDLGLGSCWVQVRERKTKDGQWAANFVKEKLNIPSSYEVLSIIAIGEKEKENNPFDETRLQLEKIISEKY